MARDSQRGHLRMDAHAAHQALCGTCNYPLGALEVNRCPECATLFDLRDDDTFNSTGRPIGWVSRILIAAPAEPVIAIALLVLPARLWELHSPERAMLATWYYGWYGTCVLILGVRIVQLLLRRVIEARFHRRAYLKRHRRRWPTWPFLSIVLLTTSALAEYRWPMRWAFAYSKGSLDSLATRALECVAASDRLAPARAGVFTVSSIVVQDDQTVVLYTCESVTTRGKWGFARIPARVHSSRDCNTENDNEPWRFQRALCIDGEWFVVYDAYWAAKDGWS